MATGSIAARSSEERPWLATCAVAACLAIFVCFVSANLHPRFPHHDEAVYNQLAILKGLPHHIDGADVEFPQFQSRILFPVLLTAASSTHLLSASQWYTVLRLLTAFAAFVAFLALCLDHEEMPLRTAALGAGALAYALVFTFNHGWEHPTDFIDVAAFSAFLWLSLRKRRAWLAVATLGATFNHQTAAFSGPLWLCLWAVDKPRTIRWSEVAYAAALTGGSYALSTAVKVAVGGERSIGYVVNGVLTIRQLLDALRHPSPYAWPVLLIAMILPTTLWLYATRRVFQQDVGRLLAAALLIVAAASPVAYWSELRSVFLAPMVILTFAAVVSEHRIRRPAL